jgi:hypothetical protein
MARLGWLEHPTYRFEVPGSQRINSLDRVIPIEITRYGVSVYEGLAIVGVLTVALRIAGWWSVRVVSKIRLTSDGSKGLYGCADGQSAWARVGWRIPCQS